MVLALTQVKDVASIISTKEVKEITNSEILVVLAIVLALGLVAVTAVEVITIQEVEAAGCPVITLAINASKGRCFDH